MNRAVVISRVYPHEPSCPTADSRDEDSQPSSGRAGVARALGRKSEGSSCLPNPVGSPAFPGQPCPPHPPTVRLYVEAGVATPGGEPTWELARAAGSARSLKPLSINCGSWSWSWRPLTASLPRHRRSLIFQSEEGGKKTLLRRPAPSNWDLGKAFPFDRIAHPWRSWEKKKKKTLGPHPEPW